MPMVTPKGVKCEESKKKFILPYLGSRKTESSVGKFEEATRKVEIEADIVF